MKSKPTTTILALVFLAVLFRQNNWRMILGGAWGDGIKANQRMSYYDIFDPRTAPAKKLTSGEICA